LAYVFDPFLAVQTNACTLKFATHEFQD